MLNNHTYNTINKENEDLINSSGYLSTEKVDNKTVYDIVNCSTRLPGDFEISKINLKEGSFDKNKQMFLCKTAYLKGDIRLFYLQKSRCFCIMRRAGFLYIAIMKRVRKGESL